MATPLKGIPILLGLWLVAIAMADGAAAAETYVAKPFSVEHGVYAVRFSPAGDRIAFATDAGAIIVDTSDGRQLGELKGEAPSVAWA